MEIIRAGVLGFCSGVRRAVDLAYEEAERSKGQRPVYTLGPLMHNPPALEELQRRGITILDEKNLPQNLHGACVIIRAHGISPQMEAALRERGAAVIDATCPRVKASQRQAAAFAADGYRLFLAGEERHAEIAGIRGYAGAAVFAIAGSAGEAEKAAAALHGENCGVKTALIGQTTISAEEYHTIGEAITPFFPNLEIAQTICAATRERQDSLRELLDVVDAVIIAGGKESANTRRLVSIAEAAGKPCALVENQADIPPDFFKFNTIGLAAGASTPDTVVDAIESALGSGKN